MKRYDLQRGDPYPIVDGYSYVFTFFEPSPTIGAVEIQLLNNLHNYYSVELNPMEAKIKILFHDGARTTYDEKHAPLEWPRNIVIRLDKISSTSLVTYVNGKLMDRPQWPSWLGDMSKLAFATNLANHACTLIIFDYAERMKMETYVQAMMKDPVTNYFEFEKEITIRDRRAVEDREKAVAGVEKAMVDREKALGTREKAAADREILLDAREEALKSEREEGGGNPGNGTDKDGGRPSSGPDVSPPDAEFLKLSSTVAWPRAVKHILGDTLFADIQERHDMLLSDWVIARSDNISSNAYDYFVYSHGVVWPKSVLESMSDDYGDSLTEIRKRHAGIMEMLA